jgi:acid stress-induced BolA-like protein IbaG/YrbA
MSSHHPTDFQGSVTDAIREAIAAAIPGADIDVHGGGGHFSITVTSPVFAGKNRVESQRLVYSAIAHLMAGDRAPVHAVDSLRTLVP